MCQSSALTHYGPSCTLLRGQFCPTKVGYGDQLILGYWDFSGFQSRSPAAPQGKWSPEMGADLVRRFEWLLLEAFACCVQADLLAAAGCLTHWVSAAFQLDFRDGSFLGIIPRVTGMLLPRASLSLVNNRPTRGTRPSQVPFPHGR